MIITVKYGDGHQKVANTQCRNGHLLNFLRKECHCHYTDALELCDETGKVKNISGNPEDYASHYFSSRETVILLKINEHEEGAESAYTPLLNELKNDAEFLDKLNSENKIKLDEKKRGQRSNRSSVKSFQRTKRATRTTSGDRQ